MHVKLNLYGWLWCKLIYDAYENLEHVAMVTVLYACVLSAHNRGSMIKHWIALRYFWSFLSVKRTEMHIHTYKTSFFCPSSVMLPVKFLHIDGGKEKETVLMVSLSTGPILQRLAQRLWSLPTLYAHDWRFIWTESPC